MKLPRFCIFGMCRHAPAGAQVGARVEAGAGEHILLVRLSAMGDAAMTVPAVKALRQARPGARITILTQPLFAAFFGDVEGVDFVRPDFKGRHKGIRGLIRLARELRALGITHMADLHDVLRTKLLRRFMGMQGIRVAVIDKGRAQKRALTRKNHKIREQLQPTVERYRDTIRRLGFEIGELVPEGRRKRPVPAEIVAIAGDRDEARRGRWIGVAPFAQHIGKIYPSQLTDRLTGMLAGAYERVFIFGGGEYEKEFGLEMERRYPGVVSVIGKIKLAQELDLISNLDVMVSMDSSGMHMASLVGTPVVSIWGATHPWAGFYGFGQDPAGAVQLDMACRPCSVYGNRPCLWGDYRCLAQISPETVMERIVETLSADERP